MSKDLNGLADELMEETLSEAAGTFFGRRKRLEEEIELLQNKIETLKQMEAEVLMRAGDLHYLLLEGRAADDFYKALDVDAGVFVEAVDPAVRFGRIRKQKALTTAGRYAKTVAEAYERLREAAHIYMHGSYVEDKEGRKRLTLNYGQIRDWCGELNKQIEKINAEASPSEVLAYVKKLDVDATEKAKITGAGSSYDESLDHEMAFDVLDCTGIDLTVAPDLPEVGKAQPGIKAFCKGLAASHKDEVEALMDSVSESRAE